ncbi:MAG: methylated-DNA--[protein]-cysteine S-methyltransferase [Rhodothermaceae bacterium]|nr:methylated-DNA--[protein]-cysteine S-methyltransferase [Rhodothermaceae bacterium]
MPIVPPHVKCGVIPDTPVGPLTLTFSSHGLMRVQFGAISECEPAGDPFNMAVKEFSAYFAGKLERFSVKLDLRGTAFQKRVWALLDTIPYGETRSYGELARRLGDVHLARAVGTANGANPVPIILPCHRVIGSNGQLTGYSGGLEHKQTLLRMETDYTGKILFNHGEDSPQ